jgi:hypothetical protein
MRVGAPTRMGAMPTLRFGVVIQVGIERKVGEEGDLRSMGCAVET